MAVTNAPKRTFIGLVLGAVLLLGICAFVYSNRACKLHILHAEVQEKQEKLANSEQIARRLPVAEREYLEATEKLSLLEQGVSTRMYVPTFLRQIEELGKKVNLRVVGVRPQVAQKSPAPARSTSAASKEEVAQVSRRAEPYDKMDIEIEVNGKYWDIVRFLYEITSFPKIVTVNDIQVNPVGQTSRLVSPMLVAKVNATAFILKDQPGASGSGHAEAVTGST